MVRAARMWARGAGRWAAITRLGMAAGMPLTVVSVTLNVLIGLSPVVFVVGTSTMIADAAQLPARHPAALMSGGMAVAFAVALGSLALQNALAPAQAAFGELVSRRVDGKCSRELMALGLRDAPMGVLEDQEVLDGLSDVRIGLTERFRTPGAAVAGLLALVARYVQLIGDLVLVAVVLGPLAGVVMGCTAIAVRGGNRGSLSRWTPILKGFAGHKRKMRFVMDTGSSLEIAKEMRLLGLLPWYTARGGDESATLFAGLWRERRRIFFAPFLLFAAIALAGASWVLLQLCDEVAARSVSVLGLSLAIQAIVFIMRFGVFFPEADVQTEVGMTAHDTLTEFRQRALASVVSETNPGARPEVDDRAPQADICFEDVSFAYPGSSRLALSGLNLSIEAGRSTAIVGLNGAGKTTVVKLLAGLYQPTAGRVTVDGLDLGKLDSRSWQRHLAAIFQDYVRYELDAEANIALGAPDRLGDAVAVRDAAEAAGAADFLRDLPSGLATPLSSRYAGGVDLSGGQWQRVALARALFAVDAGATVLILDEPTAQLDVRAEVDFFDRFLELTRGLTTVIISHRFSTVRRADRIAVLEGGRITAHGSHEELMRGGGEYARLFQLQAHRFADGRDGQREEIV
jgi:ATP-binding cassette subfamily B protein